ncbi:MAG TPA: hypothetical protein VGK87_02745, partial [Anaerolineae bacterium]
MARSCIVSDLRDITKKSIILAAMLALAGCQFQPETSTDQRTSTPDAPLTAQNNGQHAQTAAEPARSGIGNEASEQRSTEKDSKDAEAAEAEGRNDLEFYMMSYPVNTIPVGVRQRAYSQVRTQASHQGRLPQAAGWQNIGPAPLYYENLNNFTA